MAAPDLFRFADPVCQPMMLTMNPNAEYVITVTDLVDRPGASRPVDLSMAVPEDLSLALVEFPAPLRLAGVIESVVDGVLVRGRVDTTVRVSCARCLTDVTEPVSADVVELFADPDDPRDPDDDVIEAGYEIREGAIDVDTLLRDALVPAMPYQPLCQTDCQGLCATCGADRNIVACGCVERSTDSRWAALEGLRFPPGAAEA